MITTFRSLLRISILSMILGMLPILGAPTPISVSNASETVLGGLKAGDLDMDRLVDAVGVAENGPGWTERDVKYPYGLIYSSWCNEPFMGIKEKGWCRYYAQEILRIHISRCNDSVDLIECVGSYYAPPASHALNRHWKRNVLYWYNKLGGTNEMHDQKV